MTDLHERTEKILHTYEVGEGGFWLLSHEAARHIRALDDHVKELEAEREWRPIETAPKGKSILLGVCASIATIYIGRKRYGEDWEPQPREFVWREDNSGRFSHPTHWLPLPEPPRTRRKEYG